MRPSATGGSWRPRVSCVSPICSTGPVSGLAGGDRQRVALGRAIVRKPKCFLMDEPLGALDTEMREAMIHELRALHDRLGATTVYVTHDQLEAMAMADMIAVMNNGVVEQVASPRDIYDRPASLFVADFIGSPPMNFLPFRGSLQPGAQAIRLGDREVAIPVAREALAESDLVLGVRPEHVRFSDRGMVRGEVYGAEYLGTTQIVTVTTRYGAFKARSPASMSFRTGESMSGSTSGPIRCRSSTGSRAGRSAPRCMREARMAEVEIRAVSKAFGNTPAVSDMSL